MLIGPAFGFKLYACVIVSLWEKLLSVHSKQQKVSSDDIWEHIF